MLSFGQEVRDVISGFKGIITGKCDYISGCEQYLVQPKGKTSDKKPESIWFDVDRLKLVSKKRLILKKETNGFDLEAPIK